MAQPKIWGQLMHRVLYAGLVVLILTTGCQYLRDLRSLGNAEVNLPTPISYSEYHLAGWDWSSVRRVLVLPVLNESEYTRADEEFLAALSSELQRLGRFEIIVTPPDEQARLAAMIHRQGRFDEACLLELSKLTNADVVIHTTVTQYSPYPRPRMGIIVQAVAPKEGKVVGSVDGLWDTTDAAIAEDVRSFYRQRPKPLPNWIRNHVIASDDSFAGELALDSPALFQRYIANLASHILLDLPIPSTIDPGPTLQRPNLFERMFLKDECCPPPTLITMPSQAMPMTGATPAQAITPLPGR